MPLIGTRADALANRRQAPGYPTFRSDFLSEEAPRGTRRGNGKLVEQEPGTTLHAHFHYVNQFQVVVGGSGAIGRHQVRPLTVQFAGAYTTYGPLRAGPDGLDYLVLRDAINPGLRLMPEEVAAMDRSVKRRYFMSDPILPTPSAASAGETVVHAPEPDGLAASVLYLAPGSSYRASRPELGGGQFHVIASGTAACGGALYEPLCCIFSPNEEAPLELAAGPDGATVVFLQFPSAAAGLLA